MNGLVLQCGGPTAVVNVSLVALLRRWRALHPAATLWGGRHGANALLASDWIDLSSIDDEWLAAADASPGMALGGGRDRLNDRQLDEAIAMLASRSIDTLFLIGGNGTMAAGRAVAARARELHVPLRIAAVPKTIDNDIPCTDVCPGFPSAARFLIDAVRDIAADQSAMRGYEQVVLIEAMGRHAGWLAASTLAARARPHDAPHLVLVPEQPFDECAFLDAVRAQHGRDGLCIVTVAEGVRDAGGRFLTERGADAALERDASGQIILGRSGGPLPYLASLVRDGLGLRCRLVRPDVLQRCSRAHVTGVDRRIAALAGAAAVDAVGASLEPVMVALGSDGNQWRTELVPLERITGERTLPPDFDPAVLLRLVSQTGSKDPAYVRVEDANERSE